MKTATLSWLQNDGSRGFSVGDQLKENNFCISREPYFNKVVAEVFLDYPSRLANTLLQATFGLQL